MRHALFALATSTLLAVLAGCACNNCCNSCNQGHSCKKPPVAHQQPEQPLGGTVSYPYYTCRGPRDFLETHPQSIGP